MSWQTLLENDAWRSTLIHWTFGLCAFVASTLAFAFIKRLLSRQLRHIAQKTSNSIDDVFADIAASPAVAGNLGVALLVALIPLHLNEQVERGMRQAAMVLLLLQGTLWLNQSIALGVGLWKKKSELGVGSQTAAAAVVFIARLALWSMALLSAFSLLGIRVTGLVAGLGVGGVAAALAVQNVLGDLFSSLSIFFDRPFDLGDFITVGDLMGNVESIGLRSTKVRSLSGEQLIFPNSDLAGCRIHNYRRMTQRRVPFHLGVTYDTSAELLRRIPQIVREIIEAEEYTRFDRCHFQVFGDFALVFETVYYVLSADYGRFMDVQHRINLAIIERFRSDGIEFAFPTQTLHVQMQAKATPGPQ